MIKGPTAYWGLPIALAALVLAFQLPSCGGGGGTVTAPAGVTRGTITGFGSVFVNGVEYFTDNDTLRFHVDDGPSDISGLDNDVFRVGMVVEVHHGADDTDATRIEFANNLEGPVAGLAGNGFSVLGISVVTDGATNIQRDGGATLADGAIAEVSGLPDSSGVLHATFIEVKPAATVTAFEVKGYVVANNLGVDNSFTLGMVPNAGAAAKIQVDGATVFDTAGGRAGLAAGSFVEVRTASASAPILATAVEAQGSETESPDGANASIEGYPTNIYAAPKTFTLMGIGVDAAGAVVYEHPMAGFAEITGATKVEVHGTMSGGKLLASRIGPR